MVNVLLYAPEYRPNLSNMIRSAEFFGLKHIYIFDKNGLLDPPKNKATKADMEHLARVWTAGAVEHIEIRKIDDVRSFFKSYPGRKIATVIDERAQHLDQFTFQENDLIIMGPEKEGLSYSTRALCNEKVFLPNKGVTDCLNVSVMLGIMLFASLK
ncbi:MAG: TrmH family RNA methyltransferase [Saprospiraceae bacterium]|nr:TrmH family RNA methyltransferase [Saprospiraceae bacterium]